MDDLFSALGQLFGINLGGSPGVPSQPTKADVAQTQLLSFLPHGGRYEPRPAQTPVYEMPHDIGEAVMAPFRDSSTIFEPPRVPKPQTLGLQKAAVRDHSPRVSVAKAPAVSPMGEVFQPPLPTSGPIHSSETQRTLTDPTYEPPSDFSKLLVGEVPANVANKRIPAAVRTNNPGAMWGGASWQKKYGVLGKQNLNDGLGQGNNIAIFPTMEAGAAAQFDLLNRKYSNMTLQAAVRKWSGGNGSMAYALKLARATGAQLNTPMSEILSNRDRAMVFAKTAAAHEAGVKSYPMSDAQWLAGYDLYRHVNTPTKVAGK